MGARLEGDVDRGTARALAGCLERDDLGVRASPALVPAFADDHVAGDDDRADHRVRMRRPSPLLCELERTFEMRGVHETILRPK
jgi:hypothetical protein